MMSYLGLPFPKATSSLHKSGFALGIDRMKILEVDNQTIIRNQTQRPTPTTLTFYYNDFLGCLKDVDAICILFHSSSSL